MPRKVVKKWEPHKSVDRPSSYETSVWYKDKSNTLLRETDNIAIYKDKYPACDGHLLFIPKINQPRFVGEAMAEAYYHGQTQLEQGKCDGYNLGMNIGETAGQSVFWPHIHFIPRLKGDQEGEPKGIRQCYPKDPFAPGNTKEDYFEMQARLKKERRAYIDKMQKKLEAIGGKFNYGK
jgi:diadenosine tetraphosphate (Ap4A) HIT family hydrolase